MPPWHGDRRRAVDAVVERQMSVADKRGKSNRVTAAAATSRATAGKRVLAHRSVAVPGSNTPMRGSARRDTAGEPACTVVRVKTTRRFDFVAASRRGTSAEPGNAIPFASLIKQKCNLPGV